MHRILRRWTDHTMRWSVLLCLPLLATAADVSGAWSGSYYAGPIYLVLKQQGADVTGTAGPSAAQQMLILSAGKVAGDRLSFKVGPMEVSLQLKGDNLTGELKEPNDTVPLTVTRVEALARRKDVRQRESRQEGQQPRGFPIVWRRGHRRSDRRG